MQESTVITNHLNNFHFMYILIPHVHTATDRHKNTQTDTHILVILYWLEQYYFDNILQSVEYYSRVTLLVVILH